MLAKPARPAGGVNSYKNKHLKHTIMKNWLLILIAGLHLFSFSACSQNTSDHTADLVANAMSNNMKRTGWNPDAGVIPSLTVGAKVIVSSGEETAAKFIDEKKETHWQSGSPFPQNFLLRNDQNILLKY